ncbi:MAG TPA: hypothetical protein VIC24_15125 [Gemmatimonadaceae bacterium]|jgi:hypothetical protein
MSNEREELPRWVRHALREPHAARVDQVDRIMSVVRTSAAQERARRARRRATSRVRTVAMACLASAAGVSIMLASARAMWRSSLPEPFEASATLIGDSIDIALHDTFDLVRFALRTRGASRVVVAGDFNRWSQTATPLARERMPNVERWSAVVPMRRDDGRYAFLVDDTRWVRAPRAAPPSDVERAARPASSHRDST